MDKIEFLRRYDFLGGADPFLITWFFKLNGKMVDLKYSIRRREFYAADLWEYPGGFPGNTSTGMVRRGNIHDVLLPFLPPEELAFAIETSLTSDI